MTRIALFAAALAVSQLAVAEDQLPEATASNFCQVVQQIISNTDKIGENTVFDNMPDYRASKPFVDPLSNFQVSSYRGDVAIMTSCKVKGSAHLRSAYGDDAAGEQRFCPDIARMIQAQAEAELRAEGNAEAADKVAAIVIDENEPYITGREYLSDFELSYTGEDGKMHIQSPGLFQDYDSLWTLVLPEQVEGQVYCHLATKEYMKLLATGEMQTGTMMTTVDDAPTTPQG